MDTLKLSKILEGMPGISLVEGANLYENCIVMLHKINHCSPVILGIDGIVKEDVPLEWEGEVSEQLERTYADAESLTERSAVCISVLLALELTDYTVVERSRKGTGFDYMLGDKNDTFYMPKARLEISGIERETKSNNIERRFNQKTRQTDKTDYTKMPAYVSVVEFSTPKALFGKK